MFQIKCVTDRSSEREFLDFPRRLYRNDPNYVVPFDSEIRNAFDRKVNPYFNHGDAVRWIVQDGSGQTVGRIASFYDRARGTAAGVIPKFQNSGVESGIFYQLKQVMERKPNYKEFELSWVGDFNPKMIALYQATGATLAKIHHTYRYLFDPDRPCRRFMEEVVDESKIPHL